MRHWWLACICLASCVIESHNAVAQPLPPSASEQTLREVTVTAKRETDHETLARAVSAFVASHAAAGVHTSQIGRWRENLCPLVRGLQTPARDFVTSEVLKVARSVGAPVVATGEQCDVNVEVAFTLSPQALMDHIAKDYRPLLGYIPTSAHQENFTFSRPIEAWYVTGTRTLDYQKEIDAAIPPGRDITLDFTPGIHVDPYQSADSKSGAGPSGVAGSHLSKGQRSEFLHAMIIVNSNAVAKYSLEGISDYVAMLALTHLSNLETCSELPSIIDLLATGCADTPMTITAADIAYLKGLYGANLDKNLNIERGDIHEQMMRQIEAK